MQTLFETWGVWSWMSLGVILMILELLIPGTFLIWFGLGSILTGLTVLMFSGITLSIQLLIFVIMSLICVTFGILVYTKIFGKNKENEHNKKTGAHRYVGARFIVVEPIKNGRGKIAVGDSVWIALSDNDFKKGDEVTVIDVKGTQLIVK
ncbi:MAG: NfeD family protein [Alphaproteobacteria bacterium]|nr:NfeD family protein [Alphaproteobacteria bacterium]